MNGLPHRLASAGAALVGLVFLVGGLGPVRAADSLRWNKDKTLVDAEITSWDVGRLLEEVASATGWHVYLEPGTKQTVRTTFKNRTPDKALDLLLGDLNFVLLPPTNGANRLLVWRTSDKQATQRISARSTARDAKTPVPIENELIVTVKPGTNIEELARRLGAKVIGRVEGLNAYRLQFDNAEATDTAREALARNPEVTSIDLNYQVPPPPSSDDLFQPGSRPLNLRARAVGDSDRVVVALIDSAVQRHGNALDQFLLPSLAVVEGATPSDTFPSHGTAMMETLLRGLSFMMDGKDGTAVRVLPVDVYGNNAYTSTFDVANGIYKAITAGASIINLSLGSDGNTDFLYRVIKSGHEQGVLFFAAAGNEPTTSPTYPAAYREVIAVTAGDSKGNIAPYANRGDFVDVIAPGSATVEFNGQTYIVRGTSAATAYAAGAAAGLADGGKSAAGVEEAIRRNLGIKPQP